MSRPRVIAHRGASHAHPDNSWAAFEGAVEEGADAIECDVQLSADGVLVVRHDLVLAGGVAVAGQIAAQILRQAPETVLLDDLLDWQAGQPVGLLIEVKDRAAVPALMQALASRRTEDVVVGGFDCVAMAAVKQARPALRTSLMIGSVVDPATLVDLARRYRADGVHPCWEARAPRASQLLTAADVAAVHAAGLAVTLWHEEREDELAALIGLGVDAICTDTPAVLRRML
ncbi:MAG: glycerophosphodiester phosphodiesterase [Alphaproteobacteria bacterium]